MKDKVEFYLNGRLLVDVDTSMAPPVGASVCINGLWYVVAKANYAIDYAASHSERRMVYAAEVEHAS